MGRGRVIMAELSSTIGALGNLGLRNFKVLLVQENVIGAIIRRPKINRSPEHG